MSTQAARAICYDCAFSLDMARAAATGHRTAAALTEPGDLVVRGKHYADAYHRRAD